MPRQNGSVLRRFVHEHRAEDRNILSDIVTGQLAEDAVLHVGEIQWIVVQLVYPSIVQRMF